MATAMLVTVWWQPCWWQFYDVGNRIIMLKTLIIGHQDLKVITN